jgi:Protein of unknown function (DUF1648)
MARTCHKILILLMWLGLPASAWMYWSAWDRLPTRMAVHFDANWQPNGYTSRDGALQLGIGILAVMLVLFTVTTLIIDALKPQAFWPALVIAYFVLGVCSYGNYSIVNFNLQAKLVRSEMVRGKSSSQFLVEKTSSTERAIGLLPVAKLTTDN